MPLFWLECAKKLEAIAKTGIFYGSNQYEKERFEQIAAISNELISHYANLKPSKVEKFYNVENGYVTPKVDIRSVVFKDDQLLMVKEKSDGKWTIPGGWADIGYTPNEIAIKETFEEAGLEVKPIRVLAIMDKKCHAHPPSPYYAYKIFILCVSVGGFLQAGTETSEVKYFNLDELPDLSEERITKNQLNIVIERYKNPDILVYCD
jgi:ADP-ribose pyrophosphatase YjhB (NUDIX family)